MEYPEHNEGHAFLAGVGYLPFVFLNIIIPLYALIEKKGGDYGKFHALHSLSIFGTFFLFGNIISLIFGIVALSLGFSLFAGNVDFSGVDQTQVWLSIGLIYVVLLLPSIIYMLTMFFMAYSAYTGRKTKIPYLTDFLLKNI